MSKNLTYYKNKYPSSNENEKSKDIINNDNKIKEESKGIISSIKTNFIDTSTSTRVLIISMILITCGSFYWITMGNTSVNNDDEYDDDYDNNYKYNNTKSKRRVRFKDDDESYDNDENENQIDMEELIKQQQIQETSHIQSLLNNLNKLKVELNTIDIEAKTNDGNINSMIGDTKVSYDTDLTNFENEQDLSTSFMMKDDIDKKRAGMIKLQEELGKYKEHLMNKYNSLVVTIKQMGKNYESKYGTQPPINQS